MHQPDPVFPPLFKGHAIKAPATVAAEACRRAVAGELGAGDLVWSRNTAKAECALILEPEVSLARSCQMAALGFVALAETLGHLCPPQVAIEVRWPGTVLVNGGVAGHVALHAPEGAADATPPWLVVVASVSLSLAARKNEPGHTPDTTSLADEGASDVTRTAVIEALAPRLLAWLHTWGEDGFRPIHDQWLFRAEGCSSDVTVDGVVGRVLGLDEDGNLLFKAATGGVTSVAYLPHVVRAR